MIFESIILFFINIINKFVAIIPEISIFGGADVTMSPFFSVISGVGCIMPVGTLAVATGIWLLLANFDFAMSIIHWLIRKIPGVD